MGIDNRVFHAMDNQDGTWSDTTNVTQWFNLVESVASTPPEHKISDPVKRCEREMQHLGNAILHRTSMCGESAIRYQCLDIGCSGGTYDCYRSPHRVAKCAHACLWRTLLRIGYCTEKIVDLAVAKRHRLANHCSVSIIFESQDIMACFPEMGTDAEHISSFTAIAWTDKDRRCGLRMRNIPAADFVVSIKWWKCDFFRRKIELIRAEAIKITKVD